jgi:hypothetical protein
MRGTGTYCRISVNPRNLRLSVKFHKDTAKLSVIRQELRHIYLLLALPIYLFYSQSKVNIIFSYWYLSKCTVRYVLLADVDSCNFARTLAILRTYESIAEVRTKKSCRYADAHLQNWTSATLMKIQIQYRPC